MLGHGGVGWTRTCLGQDRAATGATPERVARLGAGDTEGAEAALAAASPDTEGGIDEELLDHVRRLGALLKSSPGSANGNRTA